MSRAQTAMLAAALSWGAAMTTAQAALTGLRPADLLAVEVAAGTAVTALACLLTGRRILGAWRPAMVLGFFEPGITYVFSDIGLALTSAALGSILIGLESVFLVLVVWAATRMRPVGVETGAVLAGFAGICLVGAGSGGGGSSGLGVLMLVLAALSASGYTFVGVRITPGHEPLALVTRQGLCSLLLTSPFLLGSWATGGSRLGEASPAVLLLAVLTGLIGYALPFTLWTLAAPKVTPAFTAVALNLVPISGVAVACLVHQDRLQPGQWAGGAVVLAAVAVLAGREVRQARISGQDQRAHPDGGDQQAREELDQHAPADRGERVLR
jgi:drug/metabolite transporter (DMT)-like permease